jgi:MFS family permease
MKLAMALGFWQQITGTEAVLYYSADFLEHAGLDSPTQRLLGNCFVGLCKLTPELIAMHWVDKWGRRPLMLASAVSLMSTTFLLSVAFYLNWHPLFMVILLCAVMASFSIGLGPFTFLVASENLGLSERATGMTLCAAINRCTSGTVALTAVSLYQWVGSGGLFAVYGTVGLCSLPFYFSTLPETTGQTLEELAARNREVELQKGANRSDVSGISNPPANPSGASHFA